MDAAQPPPRTSPEGPLPARWVPPAVPAGAPLRSACSPSHWGAAVREICARHGLPAGALAPFATGSDVVWAAGEHVVKLAAPPWREHVAGEHRALAHLAGRLSVRTPAPVARGELAGWPYLVMERVAGAAVGDVWPRLACAARLRLAGDLGRLARELHALSQDEPLRPAWDAFWRECRAAAPERAARGTPPELAAEVPSFLERVPLPAAEPGGPRALLHTELTDQHVLVRERAGRTEPCGLIDLADHRTGPPEYDLTPPAEFLFRGEPGVLRAFLAGYGYGADELGPELSRRLLAWSLSHRFGDLARLLAAVAPARPRSLDELAQRLYGLEA